MEKGRNILEGLSDGIRRGSSGDGVRPKVTPNGWGPDTCSNDSKGSSNSRNTNTLPLPHNDEPPMDNLVGTHFVFCYPQHPHTHTTNTPKTKTENGKNGKSTCQSSSFPRSQNQKRRVSRSGSAEVNRNGNGDSPAPSLLFGDSPKTVIRLRTSTPVEIRKASRVFMNSTSHSRNPNRDRNNRNRNNSNRDRNNRNGVEVSRCPCLGVDKSSSPSPLNQLNSNVRVENPRYTDSYDRLMEDSYGILICEGDSGSRENTRPITHTHAHPNPQFTPHSIFHVNQKLRVLCAKCLENHDPLLTDCLTSPHQFQEEHYRNPGRVPPIPSETTDYPSETEITWDDGDEGSVSSSAPSVHIPWPHKVQTLPPRPTHMPHFHPHPQPSSMMYSTMMPWGSRKEFPKEFTSREYVRTWLLTSQARLTRQHDPDLTKRGRVSKKIHGSQRIVPRVNRPRNQSHPTCHIKRGERPSLFCDFVGHESNPHIEELEDEDDEGLSMSVSGGPVEETVLPPHPPVIRYPANSCNSSTDQSNNSNTDESSQRPPSNPNDPLAMFYKDLEIIV